MVTGTIMFCWLINVKVKDIKQRNHLRKIWRDDQANELARRINWLICDIRAKQNLSELCPCKLWSAVRDSGGRPRRSVDYPGHIFYEIEDVNFYFTQVCGDCYYSVSDVEYFRKQVSNNSAECGFFDVYEVERMPRKLKPTSLGLGNRPRWFYNHYSYEISDILTHVLNISQSQLVAYLPSREWLWSHLFQR